MTMQIERETGGDREKTRPLDAATRHLLSLQNATGYWEAEMVWNSMLLSQVILTRRIVGGKHWPIPAAEREAMIQHYRVTRLPDGSWPMHGEGHGYVYMTTMAYLALRVLGLSADDPLVAPARAWLRAHGTQKAAGALAVPSWGKFWLAMLGLYGWDGVNPIPPEIFLLPDWVPLHPNNYYCHTRYIYLGIAYLYGKRFTADLGGLTSELREELSLDLPSGMKWRDLRHELAPSDLFVRPSPPLRYAWDVLARYETLPVRLMRKRALAHCYERIEFEVEASRGQGLSPVNGLLNCLALFSEGSPKLDFAMAAIDSWRWKDEAEGIRYAGAHSTAWDTAFALRALTTAPATEEFEQPVRRAYAWLKATQMQAELPGGEAQRRDPILGGWCFSDGVHRWPVSDCTAEALTAILAVHKRYDVSPSERISDERLRQAVQFILRRQNADGGFGSYERRRGSVLLEWINPSEMYGNCMTERSYTECTASCIGALARYRKNADVPAEMLTQINRAIDRGVALLRSRQHLDGGFVGFWGVNFTYAAFHVIEALMAAGVPASDPTIAKAAEWLVGKQKADGGWGEHFTSCLTDNYVEHAETQAAMTAWATLALLDVYGPAHSAVKRGLAALAKLQARGKDGAWPQQSQSGVFFATAMLDYRLYKDVFPTWALARAASLELS
jgi:lanosterol synthase